MYPHAKEYAEVLELLVDATGKLLVVIQEKRLLNDFDGAIVALKFANQLIKIIQPEVGTGLAIHCLKLTEVPHGPEAN